MFAVLIMRTAVTEKPSVVFSQNRAEIYPKPFQMEITLETALRLILERVAYKL